MNKVKSFFEKLNNYQNLFSLAICILSIIVFILGQAKSVNVMMLSAKNLFILIIYIIACLAIPIIYFLIKKEKTKYLLNTILALIIFICLFALVDYRWLGAILSGRALDENGNLMMVDSINFGFILFFIIFIIDSIYILLFSIYNGLNYYFEFKKIGDEIIENGELQITSDEIIENDAAKAIITNENKYTNKKGEEFMEYRCITLGTWQGSDMNKAIRDLEKLLNDLGKDGWTFVSIEEIKVLKGCINKQEIINKILIVGR